MFYTKRGKVYTSTTEWYSRVGFAGRSCCENGSPVSLTNPKMLQFEVSPTRQDGSHITPCSNDARAAASALFRFSRHLAHSPLSSASLSPVESVDVPDMGVDVGIAAEFAGHGLQPMQAPQNRHA